MVESINNEVVVDASWIGSLLLPDETGKESDQYLLSLKKSKTILLAPTLLQYEVTNILRSAVVSKRVSSIQSMKLLASFHKLGIDYYDLQPEDILSTAIEYRISVYDAAYVTLARLKKIPLLTLDKKLLSVMKSWK